MDGSREDRGVLLDRRGSKAALPGQRDGKPHHDLHDLVFPNEIRDLRHVGRDRLSVATATFHGPSCHCNEGCCEDPVRITDGQPDPDSPYVNAQARTSHPCVTAFSMSASRPAACASGTPPP